VRTGFLWLSGCWRPWFERAPLVVTAETKDLPVAQQLAFLHDPTTALTLSDVRAPAASSRFVLNRESWPKFGYAKDAVWAHFAVRSEDTSRHIWLLELRTARMDELDLYLVRSTGQVEHQVAGTLQGPVFAAVDSRHPVFPIRLEAGESVQMYLRVYSQTSVHLPLRIWATTTYLAAQARNEAFFAAFFGYMLAVTILSLVASAFTRNRGLVFYSLSLIVLCLQYFINSGYYRWLGLPGATVAVHEGFLLTGQVCLFLLLCYLSDFLNLPDTMPRLNRWILRPAFWVVAIGVVPLLLGPFRTMIQLLQVETILLGVMAMTLASLAWRRGNRVARFYVLGWLAFWLLIALSIVQFRGWLPMSFLPEYESAVGVALSSTLFFIAMSDRNRQMRWDVARAQAQVVELEKRISRDLRSQMQQQQQLIRDLHDGIGGLVANVGLLAEVGRRQCAGKTGSEYFARIGDLAGEGSAEIRALMNNLEARDLEWPDFIVECRRLGEMFLASHGIVFRLSIEGDTDLPGPGLFPGMSLLRIFKEAITNVSKHANASQVDVAMHFAPARFYLSIRDNGRGIGLNARSGRGMANMRSRIGELGGTLTCRVDQGTELIFEVPLPLRYPASGISVSGAAT